MAVLVSPSTVLVTRLDNGIPVISESMSHVRSVAVGIWVRVGSRSEPVKINGISHFIEHMLFKGTERRSAEDIAREVDSIGGHLDAFTGKELVGYNTKVLDQHLPIAFDILSDMLLHPNLAEEDIDKEKNVILEELKMENDNPESLIHEIFMGALYRNHPLGRPILGTRKTINSFDRLSLRDWHSRIYTPANLVVTAAGNLDHDHLVRYVDRNFGKLAAGGDSPEIEPPQALPSISLRSKRSLQQVQLCIGAPCIPANHPLRYPCYLMNIILGGSMSSRLFQNIRERQGLAYSVFSEPNLYRDAGSLAVYAGTSSENLVRLVDSVMAEFRKMKEEYVTPEELKRAKDHLKGSLMLGLESTSSRMSNLARQHLYYNQFFTPDEVMARIDGVTQEQIREVAEISFQPEHLSLTALGRLDGFSPDRNQLTC